MEIVLHAFEVSKSEDDVVVHVTGEIDVSNVSVLIDAFRQAESTEADRVVIDLTDTSFIDSSGISALSSLGKRLNLQNRSTALVCPPDNVDIARILDLMGLSEAIPVFRTLTEASVSN